MAACLPLMSLGIASAHGALGVARGDDWAHYRSAYAMASAGHFVPDPYTMTMLVGQTVMAQPLVHAFGRDMVPFQVTVAVLGGLAAYLAYVLLRGFLPAGWALFAVGCMALGPIFLGISASFMTDIPCFAFQMLCLVAGARALSTPHTSWRWLAVALSAGFVAFSIRDYGVVAPLAVLTIAMARLGHASLGMRLATVSPAGVWFAMTVALYGWRAGSGSADGAVRTIELMSPMELVTSLGRLVFTVALFTAPALVAVPARRLLEIAKRHRPKVAAAGLCLVALWLLVATHPPLFLGNYFHPLGSYASTLPGRGPAVIPLPIWVVLGLVSLLSSVALAVLAFDVVGRKSLPRQVRRSVDGDVVATHVTMATAYAFGTVVLVALIGVVTHAAMFDRYLLPALPFLVGLVVASYRREAITTATRVTAAAALVVVAAVGLTIVDASATFDGAKWQLARQVERQGYAPASIDGGLEWFAYHQPGPVIPFKPVEPDENIWWHLFKNPRVCVLLSVPDANGLYAGDRPGSLVARISSSSAVGITYVLEAHLVDPTCARA